MTTHSCDICGKTSDSDGDVLLYGDWMVHQNITVHFFCLLLSTNLPQRGGDSSGILGFLLRDIRAEITAAKRRKCFYCQDTQASVNCCKCKIYFHLSCGIENHVVSEFCHEFRSFCEDCRPLDDYQRELIKNPPEPPPICNICFKPILAFALHRIVYGDCCRKGFAHRTCMRRYALSSGYYLRCIWCRKEKFRDLIRLQSIFVPDRDATWERERNAYRELHTRHLICQVNKCFCPNGREFNRGTWNILPCKLCAAAAAHAKCLPGGKSVNSIFKCEFCSEIEERLINDSRNQVANRSKIITDHNHIDSTFYMAKTGPNNKNENVPVDDDSPVVSDDDETISTISSQITVIPSQGTQLSGATAAEALELSSNMTQPGTPVIEIPDTSDQKLGHVIRPPLALKESFFLPNEPYFYLVIYEFDDQMVRCMGKCTLRFNNDDERIKDLSPNALEQLELREEDIWFRDSIESDAEEQISES